MATDFDDALFLPKLNNLSEYNIFFFERNVPAQQQRVRMKCWANCLDCKKQYLKEIDSIEIKWNHENILSKIFW